MPDLEGLNAPQRAAVVHAGGPLVVFAGAGSGKTRVITHRVAWLIQEQDVPPWRILAVTFTNKAAGEMRERLDGLVGSRARSLWVGTFHSTCARLLRAHAEAIGIRRDFTIYDDGDQKQMVARILRDRKLDPRRYGAKQVAGYIERAKQELIPPESFEARDPFTERVAEVYADYEERMQACGALDFGDLIYRLVRALEDDAEVRQEVAGRFSHVLVDEFQDTNHAQYRLVRALCATHRNLVVVGDDDQSIYKWRGADRRNILDFRREFPDAQLIKLEQNYRSTKRILRVAHAVVRHNVDREPKELWTDNDDGQPVMVVRNEDERAEANVVVQTVRTCVGQGLALEDVAVFYRTHAQSRVLEEALRAANVSYRIVGGMRFYDRAEIKDVLAYLRVLHNPDDDVSVLRILNTPTRGIGKTTEERILDAAAQRGKGVFEAIRNAREIDTLKGKAVSRLQTFAGLIEGLRKLVEEETPLSELGEAVLDRTGYLDALKEQDTPDADAKIENVRELLGSMDEFTMEAEDATLSSFLELITLQTSADEAEGQDGDRLTLMTVHAAKGLEFPVVLVCGLEEDLFPLRGNDMYTSPEDLEEERRLAYVAFTRAERQLILSWTGVRRIYGQMRVNQPSRFLRELPTADVVEAGTQPSREARSGYRKGRIGGRPRGSGIGGLRSSPVAPPPEESYVDYGEGSDLDGPRRGMRVRHVKFGVGKVLGAADGIPPRVVVDFPGWGRKTVVVSYLEPA